MANARDIKRKISSVSSTRKITKTMKMVSASKMRRAVDAMLAARPFTEKLTDMIKDISARAGGVTSHPLLEARSDIKNICLIVITSDKGLCGAFNSNVLKAVLAFAREHNDKNIKVISVGKRANDFLSKRGFPIIDKIVGLGGKFTFTHASDLGSSITNLFENSEIDEVHLIYNEFKSTSSQITRCKKLLPLVIDNAEPEYPDFEYEPDIEALLSSLLPQFINTSIYLSMLESVAGEHGARMVAMDNATRSAGDMIKKLELNYNKTRQAAITTELLDIVNGAEALK